MRGWSKPRTAAMRSLAFVCALGSAANAFDVEVLREAGPPDRRFNLTVLGDGYRATDQEQLTTDAASMVSNLFATSPFAEYAGLFNVKLVHVVSNDSGADGGDHGAVRDTELGAYFNCAGIERLICVDDGRVLSIAAADTPEFNLALVIVNDTKYGGSGGVVTVSSIGAGVDVFTHELGHSLAQLADEYSDDGGQPPCDPLADCPEANATMRVARSEIKWNAWIDESTPIPTTSTHLGFVGLFEGARYQSSGIYRPEFDCKMRSSWQPFCRVCIEQAVRSFWSLENVRMIEESTPGPSVVMADCEPVSFRVQTPSLSPSPYRYEWSLDGASLTAEGPALDLSPEDVPPGTHTLALSVLDQTDFVRSDPAGLLSDEVSWSVSVGVLDCPGYGGAPGTGGISAVGGMPGSGGATEGSGGATEASGGTVSGGTSSGGVSTGGGAPGGDSGGASPESSGGAPSGGQGPGPADPTTAAGCGCSLPGGRAPVPSAALLAVLLALRLGRRREHR